MVTQKVEPKVIEIPKPNRTTLKVKIRSYPGSALIVNRKTQKAMDQIKNKQLGKAKEKKGAKNPKEIFENCMHRVNETYGYPAEALKKSMISVANMADLKMTDIRKSFHVIGDIIPFTKCSKPKLREDYLPLRKGGMDWRIRAQFDTWEMEHTILFNANTITAEQIVSLVDLAGFHGGFGEDRPNKSGGSHGMFEVIRK